MMKNVFQTAAIVLGLAAVAAARPWTAAEVRASAARKSNVLIQGKIDRALTLDYFLFNDGTGELLLNAANVRQSLAAGDDVVVWGRYVGRSDRYAARPEVDAIELAPAGTAEAQKICDAHSTAAPAPTPPVAPAAASPTATPAVRSIEDRLRALDDLKAKGLVTPAEYDEQRKRILQDL